MENEIEFPAEPAEKPDTTPRVIHDGPPPPPVEDPRYFVTNWHGFKVFNCRKCPFDSMYEQVFDEHFYTAHEAPQPLKQVPLKAVLFDPQGKQILERES